MSNIYITISQRLEILIENLLLFSNMSILLTHYNRHDDACRTKRLTRHFKYHSLSITLNIQRVTFKRKRRTWVVVDDRPRTVIDDRTPVIDQISGDLPLC